MARHAPASASPLTVEMGWDYYKNLTKWHVTRKVDLSSLSAKGFVHYWGGENGGDLYFLAQKAGAGENCQVQGYLQGPAFLCHFPPNDRVVHDPCSSRNPRGKRWK